MHVKINTAALHNEEVPIQDGAAQLVRMGFNPSTLPRVDRIKALAAALISECQAVQAEVPDGGREAAVAITDVQKASMMAVAAATAGL
ncbi:hypothetical protein [Roseobacter sp.]|uniref:Acb2/Tad1 domain-containing protein n=1 Tax=Roseobacter sp. TaxID=1907202 RepID=UPI00296755C2|nr:hypothetical protein [Roseobacter sp.]MDW3181754.1 hypothetical protein [Roseobacter sp.]